MGLLQSFEYWTRQAWWLDRRRRHVFRRRYAVMVTLKDALWSPRWVNGGRWCRRGFAIWSSPLVNHGAEMLLWMSSRGRKNGVAKWQMQTRGLLSAWVLNLWLFCGTFRPWKKVIWKLSAVVLTQSHCEAKLVCGKFGFSFTLSLWRFHNGI